MFDVIIMGAGPAGATLARMIAGKYKVLLVDKRFNPGIDPASTKCCGGLLAPDAQKILAVLGLALPRDILVGPQIFKVRAIDLQSGLDKYYQRFYINMDRNKFDHWLISLLPDIVETKFGRQLAGIEAGSSSIRVRLYKDNGHETHECKVLIGADGAASSVRRLLFSTAPRPRRYLAIQEWFSTIEVMPYYSAIFNPSITDFYSWIIPKDNCQVLGAALPTGKEAKTKFNLLKEQLNQYGYKLNESIKHESAPVMRPSRSGQILTGRGNVLLIGEAAGLISPSSAEGLSYAFSSALLASRAINEGLAGSAARYNTLAAPLYSSINHKLIKSILMYFTPTRQAIMFSGLFTMKS